MNITASSSSTTNARGEFRLEGVTPGRYAAFAYPSTDSDRYSDLAPFTVTDGDIAGLLVKVHVGSTIIGNVIIEGDGQPGAPRVSDLPLNVHSGSLNVAPRNNFVRVAPDGSFRTTGLPRGIASFSLGYPTPKGLELVRVERDGVEQKNAVEVGSSEEISGVKVVFAYATGVIRGQVKIEGGEITPNTMMAIGIKRAGASPYVNVTRRPVPDSRGRFVFDGLQPGDYELTLMFQVRPTTPGVPVVVKEVRQTVTVQNGTESQITMVVDLNSKDR